MNLILIVGILVAVILMAIILIQNPKGGGLASNFSQGNQIFGVEKTTDVVEKITWGGAILIVVISLIAASYNSEKTKPIKRQNQQTEESSELPMPKGK